jgi:hypothetical protein
MNPKDQEYSQAMVHNHNPPCLPEDPNIDGYDSEEISNSLLDFQSAIEDTITWHSQSYANSDDFDNSFDDDSIPSAPTDNEMETSLSLQDENSCSISQTTEVQVISEHADPLPKTFLQLKGISVANYNMACNFNVDAALKIMATYKLFILAVQEHTPWNKELSPVEQNIIEQTCTKWGFMVKISKLQLLIVDKQLHACLRNVDDYKLYASSRMCL